QLQKSTLLVADANGDTPSVGIDPSSPYALTLEMHQRPSPNGDTVPQKLLYTYMSNGAQNSSNEFVYSQPEARTVTFDSSGPTHDPSHTWWGSASMPNTPAYLFGARVASLTNTNTLNPYFGYYSITTPTTWKQAVLIRADETHALGGDGMVVDMHFDAAAYTH